MKEHISKPLTSTADEIWMAENIDLLQEIGVLLKKLLGATCLPLHTIFKKLDLALTYSRKNSWNLFKQYLTVSKGTITSGTSPPTLYTLSIGSEIGFQSQGLLLRCITLSLQSSITRSRQNAPPMGTAHGSCRSSSGEIALFGQTKRTSYHQTTSTWRH